MLLTESRTSPSAQQSSSIKPTPPAAMTRHPAVAIEQLLHEVQDSFQSHLNVDALLALSIALQDELRQHLKSSPQCMLPSFNYTLPTGDERGTYLAIEVGGSNLRIALVRLRGRNRRKDSLQIRRTTTSPISRDVRELKGYSFFDWMAGKIRDMLILEGEMREDAEPLRMGVAWSFPIDQTSIRSGNVLGMGKGFVCSDLIKDQDLGDIIAQACQRANLNVSLDAIVNDTSSALLARAYIDPATRSAIVLGTGMNAAIHVPIAALHPSKFGSRIIKPRFGTTHVLTNTEFSMFGKGIFPTSRWDDILNAAHMMPDYQPFEYLIAGGYLGEIVRLVLVEATETAGLYGGDLPPSLRTPYSLDTRTLAHIDTDKTPWLVKARSILQEQHPSTRPPSLADTSFIQKVVHAVTHRSRVYFTTGVHALTSLLEDLDSKTGLSSELDHVSIGCDGSVINKYPGYMESVQELLNQMRLRQGSGESKRIILEKTQDSAVLGAGVAGALAGQPP